MSYSNYEEKFTQEINTYNYSFDDKMKYIILKNIKEILNNNFTKIKNVLEVGCYMGSMTKILSETFDNVTVIEPSKQCINQLQNKFNNVKFINTILENYDTDEKYDLIIISHTLEHMENQVLSLKKAYSLLKKDGYIYVIVPNGTSISRLIAEKLKIIPYACCVTDGEKTHGHYITYDLYTLERHFREANINIINKGGLVLKIFGNKQYDDAFKHNIIDDNFINACYELGKERPMDCASIYIIGKNK
jgi:2-polyprenyl-3-methyl-5-hydroxy-6-metoxy-1,4-benzoquinol methylase